MRCQDLATSILYRNLVLTYGASQKLAVQLVKNPSLVLHIRSVFTSPSGYYFPDDLGEVLSQTSDLVWVHSVKVKPTRKICELPRMHWNAFAALAKTSGSTLLAFHNVCIVKKTSLRKEPSVFDRFVKLRSLRWCSFIRFAVDYPTSPVCLATLESIHFTYYDKTFADVLCRME
jgi:hypothetical protein